MITTIWRPGATAGQKEPTNAERQTWLCEKLKREREGKTDRDRLFGARALLLATQGKAIVMRRLSITDMAATVTVNKWIRDAGASVAKLAECIAAADKQRRSIPQWCHSDDWVAKEATAGPLLPFEPMAVG